MIIQRRLSFLPGCHHTAGKQKCSGGGWSHTVHNFKCLGCPSHSSRTVNTYRIVSPSFMFCVWCIWHLDAISEEPWNSNDSFAVFHHVLVRREYVYNTHNTSPLFSEAAWLTSTVLWRIEDYREGFGFYFLFARWYHGVFRVAFCEIRQTWWNIMHRITLQSLHLWSSFCWFILNSIGQCKWYNVRSTTVRMKYSTRTFLLSMLFIIWLFMPSN